MHRSRTLVVWALVAVAAAAVGAWAFPRAYPLFPFDWSVSKDEAEAMALERIRPLGEVPDAPYVTTRLRVDPILERRVQSRIPAVGAARLAASQPGHEIVVWETSVYAPGAGVNEWTYRVLITPAGDVAGVILRLPEGESAPPIDPAAARARADAYLASQGIDPARYGEPEVRIHELDGRTDLELRYRDPDDLLGPDDAFGFKVMFAGDRLAGYDSFFDHPADAGAGLRMLVLLNQAWVFLPIPLLPLVAIFFLRRYHAGEIGVRRGLEILAVVVAGGLVVLLLAAEAVSANFGFPLLTRRQVTVVTVFQMLVLFFFPMGLMAMVSWSVGESLCRERFGRRLAAFDALFKLDWANATFARASLVGLASGLGLTALVWLAALPLRGFDAWPSLYIQLGGWWPSVAWFALPLVGLVVGYALYSELFGRLLLVSALERRLGTWGGGAVAALAGSVLFMPSILVLPIPLSLPLWLLLSAALVALFVRYGLFTALYAAVVLGIAGAAYPMLLVDETSLQVQAALALVAGGLPFLVSARYLVSDRELAYRYEDVPPHVRRIAERERQRVELETARRIQSSILPELPPRLNGVEIAHAYLPATEVGGDFYDVLALEDGRLAVAVGDVAGHGVSSGLVMSMARSALAVQVTFDPRVESVFGTLNRMVYQTARKRLLTTLCYALLDPVRHELVYASAGHLFPYRIGRDGRVEPLESVAYPLGVRLKLEVATRTARLAAGDTVFLCSDGVVEATSRTGDEPFGFARLEQSLSSHCLDGVEAMRDGVLRDLGRFTGPAPRQDDQTLLVLRLPA